MNLALKLSAKGFTGMLGVFLFLCALPSALRAQSQFLTVDCTGATPWAYSSINAALFNATPGTFILVTGPCNENVSIYAHTNLNLGAYYGQTATINGSITVSNSTNLFLYGLNVTNPYGDGISVWSSRSVTLDSCNSSGNAGVGLQVGAVSDVSVNAMGTFNRNAHGGIHISGSSTLSLGGWAGPIDSSNNAGPGIWASQANISTLGHTTITNNVFGAGSSSGLGLEFWGGTHVQFGALSSFGQNLVSGNQSGGASLNETAEISFWSFGFGPYTPGTMIQANGPVGVSAGTGSQVTFSGIGGGIGAQVTGHGSAGVEIFGNSQFYVLGANLIQKNGSLSDPRSAGIRLDGNSQALLRGGEVSQNNGPGLLALVNSSADFTGVTFVANSGGIINCDSSSYMVSDLTQPLNVVPQNGLGCRTPHALGNRRVSNAAPSVPDWSAQKALHDQYAKAAVKH